MKIGSIVNDLSLVLGKELFHALALLYEVKYR